MSAGLITENKTVGEDEQLLHTPSNWGVSDVVCIINNEGRTFLTIHGGYGIKNTQSDGCKSIQCMDKASDWSADDYLLVSLVLAVMFVVFFALGRATS
ncbi:MAG: hypothetical protein ACTTH5_00110 [Wolinella sp.]